MINQEIEKLFVPCDLSFELKQLGFDEPCFKGYTEEYKTLINFLNIHTNTSVKNTLPTKSFTAPIFSQAFNWFEKEFNLYVNKTGNKNYTSFSMVEPEIIVLSYFDYNTTKNHYIEAEIACLKKLIEIVKNKL